MSLDANRVSDPADETMTMGAHMSLPGFTAATSIYRGRHTYRAPVMAGSLSPALTPAYEFCANRELDHNYPHPYDCGKYIACELSGKATEMPCVEGLHFMEDGTRWGHCDYPHIANCELD
jgi:hypothetical protein